MDGMHELHQWYFSTGATTATPNTTASYILRPSCATPILRAALHAARLVAEHHDQRTMLRTIRDVSRRILHAAQ